MIITQERLDYLMSEDAFETEEIALLHGTSTEMVLKMLETGKLPTGITNVTKDLEILLKNHPTTNNYLYFFANKEAFANHPFYNQITHRKNELKLFENATFYAGENEMESYLRNLLGFWSYDLGIEEALERIYCEGDWDLLQKQGINTQKIKEYGINKLLRELKQLKGTVLGINLKALELPIEDGSDAPGEETMIYLPKGLDIKYIGYIQINGEYEKRKLAEFVKLL